MLAQSPAPHQVQQADMLPSPEEATTARRPFCRIEFPVSLAEGMQSRLRKFEQVDKWNFCLKAAMVAANRRDHEQTTAPEPQPGFQGEGGACRRQGRPDDSSTGRALRRPPQSGDSLESSA